MKQKNNFFNIMIRILYFKKIFSTKYIIKFYFFNILNFISSRVSRI